MDDEKPPLFTTWNKFYAFVMLMHTLVVLLLTYITFQYS